MPFTGVIIEESLKDIALLSNLRIISTKVEQVTDKHKTSWLRQWTLHTVEIPDEEIVIISEKLSHILDGSKSWYADFKDEHTHYIIFKDKVFCIDRNKKEEYEAATAYGITLGIPEHQVDFSPHIKKWER